MPNSQLTAQNEDNSIDGWMHKQGSNIKCGEKDCQPSILFILF